MTSTATANKLVKIRAHGKRSALAFKSTLLSLIKRTTLALKALSPHAPRRPILPNELWIIIISHLDRSELAAAARVSRLFYAECNPLLYRSIRVQPIQEECAEAGTGADESAEQEDAEAGIDAEGSEAGTGADDSAEQEDAEAGTDAEGPEAGIVAGSECSGHSARYSLYYKLSMNLSKTWRRSPSPPSPLAPPRTTSLYHKLFVRISRTLNRNPPLPLLPDRFAFTENLTIYHHCPSMCSHLLPLNLPNLITLRVMAGDWFDGGPNGTLDVCVQPSGQDDLRISSPLACCPFIANLRPKRLIIGNFSGYISGSGIGLWPSSPLPPSSIEEVVIFVGRNNQDLSTLTKESDGSTHPLLERMQRSVKRLTLILWTWEGEMAKERYGWCEHEEVELWDLEETIRLLAIACSGDAGMVEVVGVETLNPKWELAVVERVIEYIRGALVAELEDWGQTVTERETRAKSIKFITGDDYLSREGDEKTRQSREAVMEAIEGDWSSVWAHDIRTR